MAPGPALDAASPSAGLSGMYRTSHAAQPDGLARAFFDTLQERSLIRLRTMIWMAMGNEAPDRFQIPPAPLF